ncbi:MAG: hypothetical protein QNL64_01235 [Porticoccus sp.]
MAFIARPSLSTAIESLTFSSASTVEAKTLKVCSTTEPASVTAVFLWLITLL